MGEPQVTKEKEMEEVKSTLTKEKRDDEGTLENQGPKEMKMNEVTKIAAVIRLITMAATMTTVKGQGDENDEEDTGMWHVKLALMIYTVLVILNLDHNPLVDAPEGGSTTERSSFVKRKCTSCGKPSQDTTKKRYEDEAPRPAGLPSPTQSPVPFVSAHLFLHSRTQSTEPQAQILLPIPALPGGTSSVPVSGCASQPASGAAGGHQHVPENETHLSSWMTTPTSLEDPQVAVKKKKEEEERKLKEEEERSKGAALSHAVTPSTMARKKSERSQAPKEDPPHGDDEDERGPEVLTTRYGKAYHRTRSCDYLRAARTGAALKSKWCSKCLSDAPGGPWNIWTNSWGGTAHSNRACEDLDRSNLMRRTPCTRCVPSQSSGSLS